MRKLSAKERTADSIIHIMGVAAGSIAVVIMLVAAALSLPAPSTASLAVYGAAMLAMLGCSAAYHMAALPARKRVLQRFDHAAIFFKIAGTYTPFVIVKMGSLAGFALLSAVWAVALLGAGAKLLLASSWDRIAVVLYLTLGWAGVVMFQPLAASVPLGALVLLGLGGGLYSLGVVFHLWTGLPYQTAVWHGFVLAGTACHFGAVTGAVFA